MKISFLLILSFLLMPDLLATGDARKKLKLYSLREEANKLERFLRDLERREPNLNLSLSENLLNVFVLAQGKFITNLAVNLQLLEAELLEQRDLILTINWKKNLFCLMREKIQQLVKSIRLKDDYFDISYYSLKDLHFDYDKKYHKNMKKKSLGTVVNGSPKELCSKFKSRIIFRLNQLLSLYKDFNLNFKDYSAEPPEILDISEQDLKNLLTINIKSCH